MRVEVFDAMGRIPERRIPLPQESAFRQYFIRKANAEL